MKQAIVIDKNSIKVEFVLVDLENKPLYYTLKDGEKLIFENVENAFNLVKPKWNGNNWEESATKEEIRQIEEERKRQFGNFEIDKNIISENEMLKAQNKALSDRLDFAEELIAELATKVY